MNVDTSRTFHSVAAAQDHYVLAGRHSNHDESMVFFLSSFTNPQRADETRTMAPYSSPPRGKQRSNGGQRIVELGLL